MIFDSYSDQCIDLQQKWIEIKHLYIFLNNRKYMKYLAGKGLNYFFLTHACCATCWVYLAPRVRHVPALKPRISLVTGGFLLIEFLNRGKTIFLQKRPFSNESKATRLLDKNLSIGPVGSFAFMKYFSRFADTNCLLNKPVRDRERGPVASFRIQIWAKAGHLIRKVETGQIGWNRFTDSEKWVFINIITNIDFVWY